MSVSTIDTRPFGYVTVVLAMAVGGCTGVNFDYPRQSSTQLIDTTGTYLAAEVAVATENKPDSMSGFYPLADGIDAAAARFRLIDIAERSIDAQYYLIKQDQVGQQFLFALLQAAERGVRVRLLVDDMYTRGMDTTLLALDSHPNFSVRVFNPFNRGLLGRTVGAAVSFPRINRRMHNKSLTIDNQITIVGGRNIADEYFGARADSAFGDLDVIGIGPVVQAVSSMFDQYWQHRTAVPLAGFMQPLRDPPAALSALRSHLAEQEAKLLQTRYAEAVKERAYRQVETDISVFRWSPYQLIYDPPAKGVRGAAQADELITAALQSSLERAAAEIIIVSPYFVPRTRFRDDLIALQTSGVQLRIITNSLAANNQKTVHGGYAPARAPLLQAGVELYEIRPDAYVAGSEYVDADAPRSTLHSKTYIVDRREVFIGSFNFDPRSANINTEMGVLINDPELGAGFAQRIDDALHDAAWQVSTDERGLLWSDTTDAVMTQTSRTEPMTNWWQRFMAGLYRLLPIRSQL